MLPPSARNLGRIADLMERDSNALVGFHVVGFPVRSTMQSLKGPSSNPNEWKIDMKTRHLKASIFIPIMLAALMLQGCGGGEAQTNEASKDEPAIATSSMETSPQQEFIDQVIEQYQDSKIEEVSEVIKIAITGSGDLSRLVASNLDKTVAEGPFRFEKGDPLDAQILIIDGTDNELVYEGTQIKNQLSKGKVVVFDVPHDGSTAVASELIADISGFKPSKFPVVLANFSKEKDSGFIVESPAANQLESWEYMSNLLLAAIPADIEE